MRLCFHAVFAITFVASAALNSNAASTVSTIFIDQNDWNVRSLRQINEFDGILVDSDFLRRRWSSELFALRWNNCGLRLSEKTAGYRRIHPSENG